MALRGLSLVLARGAYGVLAVRPIKADIPAPMGPELGQSRSWFSTYSLPMRTSLLDLDPHRLAGRPSPLEQPYVSNQIRADWPADRPPLEGDSTPANGRTYVKRIPL